MKRWLARCLAGTLGCAALAVAALLLSGMLAAGRDFSGANVFRIVAMVLGSVTLLGLATMVVMMAVTVLKTAPTQAPSATKSTPS